MKLTRLFVEFIRSEQAGGLLLLFCAIIALLLSNSALQHDYLSVWHFLILGETSGHWINDGLMTVFFLPIFELDTTSD